MVMLVTRILYSQVIFRLNKTEANYKYIQQLKHIYLNITQLTNPAIEKL